LNSSRALACTHILCVCISVCVGVRVCIPLIHTYTYTYICKYMYMHMYIYQHPHDRPQQAKSSPVHPIPATWLTHSWDLTDSCGTWLIFMCDMTHSYARSPRIHPIPARATWLTHTWDMTYSCGTWLILMCDMTHSYVKLSLTRALAKSLPHIRDMTHPYAYGVATISRLLRSLLQIIVSFIGLFCKRDL